jgi:hypothetical protein
VITQFLGSPTDIHLLWEKVVYLVSHESSRPEGRRRTEVRPNQQVVTNLGLLNARGEQLPDVNSGSELVAAAGLKSSS